MPTAPGGKPALPPGPLPATSRAKLPVPSQKSYLEAEEESRVQIPKDLEYFLESADVFLISGRIGAGKSWFAENVLKARIEDPHRLSGRADFSGTSGYPFDRAPNWEKNSVWGVDSIDFWEPISLRAAIENAKAELNRSRKLAFLTCYEDEIEKAGITLSGNICHIRFTDVGVANLQLGDRQTHIKLRKEKDGSVRIVEDSKNENKASAGGIAFLAWLARVLIFGPFSIMGMPINLCFVSIAGYASFKLAILASSFALSRIALFVVFFSIQVFFFNVLINLFFRAFSQHEESDI